jgi:hypothetical protein
LPLPFALAVRPCRCYCSAFALAFLVVIPEGDLLLLLLAVLASTVVSLQHSTALKLISRQPFSIKTQTKSPASHNTEQETQ